MLFGMDLVTLIKAAGYLGIFFITFAESGLFIGFFLPGDSLLFTAGFLASQGFLKISTLMVISFLGAVLGDSVGYAFGKNIGPKIFTKEESIFFSKEHLVRAKKFYDAHGPKAIVLARFMPIVRTFAPILAGVGNMHYGTFIFYNVLGGAFWSFGLSGLGYYLGSTIPNIDRYLLPIIAAIIIASIAPTAIHILKNKEYRNQILLSVKNALRKRKLPPSY